MSDPTTAIARLMAEAAALRAAGASWEAVSLRARRRVQVCKRWPEQHAVLWERLLADARKQLRENVAGEAITTLRQLLRSEKELIRRDAAKLLLGAAPEAPPSAPSELEAFLVELTPAVEATNDCPAA